MAVLIAYPAGAQVVRGIVIEAEGRAPISGAVIELLGERGGAPLRATSDSLGLFVLSLPRAGTYTVQARRLGNVTSPPDTLRIGTGESVSIELRLGERVVPLEPMVVTIRGNQWLAELERRRTGGFGRFLTRADLDARPVSRTTDLFRTMPGLIITQRRRGPGSNLQMRGPTGMCQPAVWVDGLYVSLPAGGATIDDLLSPQVIEAVEVYNSSASAPTQYRTGTCGVLLFWTRRGATEEGTRFRWKRVVLGAGAAALFILLIR